MLGSLPITKWRTSGRARASAAAYEANWSRASSVSGVVRFPKFVTVIITVTPSSFAASTTLSSTARSSALGSV
jgi:hypothetical protein